MEEVSHPPISRFVLSPSLIEIIFVHPTAAAKEEEAKPSAVHLTYEEAEKLVDELC